ncbi:Helicase C-terminal [Penicillium canariense]|uniref:Helicase C-terminal n=1 Tax=Penicillium canariense TaxID=189055 RepID=A0A9W9IH62_9EURO|nr:Helicase C-terminal [Penicillium canariense]KAJ5175561.1 Helicase C-terminal [Penicillium canariense]
MDQLLGYSATDLAKRDWEQLKTPPAVEDSDPKPKRQCVENPYMTPWVSPSSNQFGDIDLSSPPDNGRATFEDMQPIEEFESMFSAGPLTNEAQEEPSLSLIEHSANHWLLLPDTVDIENPLPTPNSGYSDSCLQDEKTPVPTVCSEHDFKMSQTPSNSPYDVCFGMVVLQASCHSLPKGTEDSVPVDLQVVGDVLKLSGGSPKHNVGLLHSQALGKLAHDCKVTLSARCERPKQEKASRMTLGHKDTLVKIVIYGLLDETDLVNSILSDGDMFLQHPRQGDTSVPYRNPQFLVAPGTEMPQIEELDTGNLLHSTDLDRALDNPWSSEVFQAFDTVDGPATFAAVEQSPRLQTKLKEHQIKALSMMTEKESSVFVGAHFPPLWRFSRDLAGNVKYHHTITGMTSDVQPQPPLGGILADSMGLGKTLSILALIAWYLDSPSLDKFGPRATLVITTPSTIPGWEQQILR